MLLVSPTGGVGGEMTFIACRSCDGSASWRAPAGRARGRLPEHLDAFVTAWTHERARQRGLTEARPKLADEVRRPVEQMLRLVVPGFTGRGRPRAAVPFQVGAPGFFAYLRDERGLRTASIDGYRHYLTRFEAYLERIALHDLGALSPAVLSAFVADRSPRLSRTSLRDLCGTLRVFLRY